MDRPTLEQMQRDMEDRSLQQYYRIEKSKEDVARKKATCVPGDLQRSQEEEEEKSWKKV